MWYIAKNAQTGWEGPLPVYEFTVYNTDSKEKTTLKATSIDSLLKFNTIKKIAPSIAQRKQFHLYRSVPAFEFI